MTRLAFAALALLCTFALPHQLRASIVITGLDPVIDNGTPDGWSGITVLTTPVAAPGDGATEGKVTAFNFWAESGRTDGGHRVTPLLLLESGGTYRIVGIGTERVPSSAGAQSNSFGLVAGSDVVDLGAGNYHVGILQQADGTDDTNAATVPFAGNSGAGMFQMNTVGPDHALAVDDVVSAGHSSPAGGRDYSFNLAIDFASDPLAPTDLDLTLIELFPGMPTGSEIGTFATTDPNAGDTHSYSLVTNPGNTFAVDGDKLDTATELGPQGTAYTIRVRTTDGDSLTFEKDFVLSVAAAQPPTDITLSSSSVAASLPTGGLVGQLATADGNAGDSHSYTLVAGPGAIDNGLFNIAGDELRLASAIPAGRSSLQLRLRTTDLSGASFEKSFTLAVSDPTIRINEFVASNAGPLADEDGDESDWIELLNEQGSSANLVGWYLTDDPDDLTKWQFPSTPIASSAYMIVFASGKNRAIAGSELHTNFQLSSSGDFLALVKPDGMTIADQYSFGQQFPNISTGTSGTGDSQGFLTPTPDAANGSTFEFGLNEVTFSHQRGHYDANFNLSLGSIVPGSTIRYTTDGSKPSASSGTVYSSPISISPSTGTTARGTRIVRAIAVHPDAAVAKVSTHSYIFVNGVTSPTADGVVNQGNLKSSIKNHATYGPLLDDALLALPTVSITGGIPGSGEAERSIEFFVPGNTEPGFQLDAGMKVVGGHSVSSPKNNFRIYIRGDYGQSKLEYPLFADHPYSNGATDVFNRLNLRSGSHDSFFWLASPGNPPNSGGPQKGDAQYIRNRWINDMQFAMGHESQHGRFVQLYINGEYRGQYQLHEWPNDDFTASYLGGDSSEYEFTNGASTSKSGSDNWQAIWNTMKASANSSFTAAQQWIDMESLADYMLLNFYAGNPWDWNPNQNWMASGPNMPGQNGWIFHGWDSDICLQDPNANVLGKNVPDGVFTAMMNHEDFRVLFRDRVYKHCFNDGVLTPSAVEQFHSYRADEIRTSIVAETARWQGGASSAPWDRDGEWQTELNRMGNYFSIRTDILLGQLRARSNWYPVDAPEFDMRGGTVPAGHTPQLTTTTGTIYYTTDGSDPRLAGGGVNPVASSIGGGITDQMILQGADWKYLADGTDQGTAWRTTSYIDTAWPAGPAELGYGEGDEATDVGFVDTDPGTSGNQRNITTYYRHSFNVTNAADYTGLQLELKRDDGAVVYLNGQEIVRSTNMPAGAIDYQTSSGSASDDGNTFIPFSLGGAQFTFVEGTNVLAVEIHQSSPASSDTSFDLSLSATRPAAGGGLVITDATLVRARVFDGTTWSGLNEASFVLTGTETVDATNSVLTEINYNPEGDDSFEFLEFKNTSTDPVDFSGAKLSGAITFEFPIGTVVPAGGYLVVTEDDAEFSIRYMDSNSPWFHSEIMLAAGSWSGGLSNSGEPITFTGVTGAPIFNFAYSDSGSWPGRADGDGSSAELESPESVPTTIGDNNLFLASGNNWRPSSEYNGSPGRAGLGPDNRVVINEVLAHTDLPQTDQIELFNQSGTPIAVGGWFLSDSSTDYKKFRLPAGTTLQTAGFLALDESAFNNVGDPDNLVPFALSSSTGDDVYLLEADSSGNLLRFVDRVSFGASKNGESFGRWPDGTGDLYPAIANTFGATNSSVRTGPVVVTEIHYNPDGPDDDVEFIQLCNPGAIAEPLDNWRLRGEVDYDFPAGLTLQPGATLLLVGFDPADSVRNSAFLQRYGLAAETVLHGPWNDNGTFPTKLDDGGGSIRLQRPDALETPTDGSPPFYPMLVEDTVNYDDETPWPLAADGTGASLQRIDTAVYGDAADNWRASSTPLGESFDDWLANVFPGGTPAADLLPDADPDRDGLTNFAEYAFVLDPTVAEASGILDIDRGENESILTISHRARPGVHGLSYIIATSTDLINWSSDHPDIVTISSTIESDGSRLVTAEFTSPGGLPDALFIRIEVEAAD